MKTVNVGIPTLDRDITQVFDLDRDITAAIGDAGERGDSGMGMGYRDIEYTGTDADEIIRRARTVAPEGTTYTDMTD